MTPMSLVDILDEDLKGAALTPWSIAQVALAILGTGAFSFGLIFAEVRRMHMPIVRILENLRFAFAWMQRFGRKYFWSLWVTAVRSVKPVE